MNLEKPELARVAARVTDNTRRFNLREGLVADDDRLPDRLTREKLEGGQGISAEEVRTLVQDYYELRGWDGEGVPPKTGG